MRRIFSWPRFPLVVCFVGIVLVASAHARAPFESEFFALRAPAASGRSLEDDRDNEPATELVEPSASEASESLGIVTAELTPEQEALKAKVRRCLAAYYNRPARTSEHSPWGIMHAAIAFGVDTNILANDRSVNALGYLCWNGPCRGQRLFSLRGDSLYPQEGPGVQGHPGQFLAILAQSKVGSDYTIKVQGRDFQVADLIAYEQRTCREKTELTFKLIGLAHYLDSNATWQNAQGQRWDIPKLIQEELAQPVVGGTCGGTHRMMGFAYAVRRREKQEQPVDGEWLRAKKYLQSYHEYTLGLQNPDGSFSTSYFEGRGDFGTAAKRLETTGHILEWLVYSLPKDELSDPRVMKAVDYLVTLLSQPDGRWQIGPLGHAVHGLAIYDERVFGGTPGQRGMIFAQDGGHGSN